MCFESTKNKSILWWKTKCNKISLHLQKTNKEDKIMKLIGRLLEMIWAGQVKTPNHRTILRQIITIFKSEKTPEKFNN